MAFQMMLRPLLVGLVTGAVCVGGLHFGLKLLLKTQADETLPKGKRVRNIFLSVGLLGGQLGMALWILFKAKVGQENPMVFGIGLIGSTFVFGLLSKWTSDA